MKKIVYCLLVLGALAADAVVQQLEQLKTVLAGKRVGMLTNPTSITDSIDFVPDMLALDTNNTFRLACFFAAEHGLRGDQQAGASVDDYTDAKTGLPVYSIYNGNYAPTDEMLANVDAVLYDIQDVGTRFYTFVWSMTYAMEAAARNGKLFVVLDRPNPIGADIVEGPPNTVNAGLIGRVWDGAPFGVPTRHGMTAGEIAKMVDAEWMSPKLGDSLVVIPVPNYKRSDTFTDLNRPWVMPSPNMPTWEGTAIVYPGTGHFENTPQISDGRGTTRPFEFIGTPLAADSIAADKYAEAMNALGLPGVKFRTAFFTPTFDKLANQFCGGVQVHVTDRKTFKSVVTGLEMVRMYVNMFNATVASSMDTKCGIVDFAARVASTPISQFEAEWQENLAKFLAIRAKYLLYA